MSVRMEMSINKATPTSALELRSGGRIPKTTDSEDNASASLASSQSDQGNIRGSPFLKLPAELRNQIYCYLLHALYDIQISRIVTDHLEASKRALRRRYPGFLDTKTWKSYGDDIKYWVTATGLHPAILLANRQTYLEASRVLYSGNCFDFCVGVGSFPFTAMATVIPFLKDRSEGSRRLIKEIKVCYIVTEFLTPCQHHLFEEICNYLSQNLQLERVTLGFADRWLLQAYHSHTDYMSWLSYLDKQNWIQQFFPPIRKPGAFRIDGRVDGDANLASAVQVYLESKLPNASKTLCQSEIGGEPEHGPTAPEESDHLDF